MAVKSRNSFKSAAAESAFIPTIFAGAINYSFKAAVGALFPSGISVLAF